MSYPYFNQQFVPGWNQVQPQQVPQAPQPIVMRQLLTPDQINLLKENSASRDGFFTPVTRVEEAANVCTHKHPNGAFAVTDPDADGYRRCTICNTRFRLVEPDDVTIQEVIEWSKKGLDLMESIKLYKGDIDPEVGGMVYQASSIIRQFPNMWKNASDYIKRAVSGPQNGYNMYQRGPSPMGMFNMIYSGVQPMLYPQQPVMPQYQYVQPQQPVMPQMVPVQQTPAQQPVQQQVPPQAQAQAQVPQQAVVPQYAYTPVAPLTPVMTSPGQQMVNPIGYVTAQQMTAPAASAQPTAAPVNQTVTIPTPEEINK